jgi:hypothetical protein
LLLGLREHVWILVPITAPLVGQLPQVKFGPGLRDVVLIGVGVAYFTLIAFKVVRRKPKFEALDFWIYLTVLYIFLTWLRHPTGGLVLNSERIGGRAYLNTAMACLSYWILARSSLPSNAMAWWLTMLTIGVSWFQSIIDVLRTLVPSIGVGVGQYYGGLPTEDDPDPMSIDPGAEDVGRHPFIGAFAGPAARWALARFRPLTLINPMYFWRFALFMISVFASLLGGFRSGVVSLAAYFAAATFVRGGFFQLFRVLVVGAVGALIITAGSYFVHMPNAVQRSLSFLPGQWDDAAVADARASSEWRYYMWRIMLTDPRYIENKWLGDGFGFSSQQFSAISQAKTVADQQENFMIIGQVHSGPVTAIRYVGYVGLLIHTILMFYMAWLAFRICRASLGTGLSTLSLFFGIVIMWEPFNFYLIFGSYDGDLPNQIYWAGILKMLGNSLETLGGAPAKPVEEPPAQRPGPRRRRVARPPRPVPAFR